ncbi:MAG: P-II family nitrogen regulator [Gammaproteobacteria bacterium]
MHFKLIIALVEEIEADGVMKAARHAGVMGATELPFARGEGLEHVQTFFGLNLETRMEVLLFLVEEHMSRSVLEQIEQVGKIDATPGTGIAFQLNVEDVVGVTHQIQKLKKLVEEQI